MIQLPKSILGIIAVVFVLFLVSPRFYQSVPAGHVGVATLFGKVQSNSFTEQSIWFLNFVVFKTVGI